MNIPNISSFRNPVQVQMNRPSSLLDAVKPTMLDRHDVAEIGGAVVGGVWGYTMGSSIGSMLGPTTSVVLGVGGAYYMGNWGHNAGIKTAACVAGGSLLLGHLGNSMLGPIGGVAGSIGGGMLGGMIASKIGNKQQQ